MPLSIVSRYDVLIVTGITSRESITRRRLELLKSGARRACVAVVAFYTSATTNRLWRAKIASPT